MTVFDVFESVKANVVKFCLDSQTSDYSRWIHVSVNVVLIFWKLYFLNFDRYSLEYRTISWLYFKKPYMYEEVDCLTKNKQTQSARFLPEVKKSNFFEEFFESEFNRFICR